MRYVMLADSTLSSVELKRHELRACAEKIKLVRTRGQDGEVFRLRRRGTCKGVDLIGAFSSHNVGFQTGKA